MSAHDARSLAQRVAHESQTLSRQQTIIQMSAAAAMLLLVVSVGAWTLGDGRWLSWSRVVPFVLWAIVLTAAVVAYRLTGARVAAPIRSPDLAHGIERERGLRPGALRGALEVADEGVLGARAAADVQAQLGHGQVLMPAQRKRLNSRIAIGSTAMVGAIALVLLTVLRVNDGMAAMLHPIDAWRGLLLPSLRFDSLPAEMPRGMPLMVRVVAPGRTSVVVAVRTDGAAWREDTLPVNAATSMAELDVGAVRAPLTIRVDDGRAPLLTASVAVGDRGWIGDVQIDAVYPSYLARPAERLELGGVLRVPRGTELRVSAVAYAGARDVRLQRNADNVPFETLGESTLAARLVVNADGEWSWRATPTPRADGGMLPVELPPSLRIGMIPDAPPEIAILAPLTDSTISTSGRVTLAVGARDDHALRTVSLLVHRERADGGRDTPTRVALLDEPLPLWQGLYDLTLDGRSLQAGDRLVIVAQAIDASPWQQSAESRRLVLRVPSAEEQRVLARSLADSLMARAAAISAAETELQRNTANAARSRDLQSGAPASGGASSQQSPDGSRGKAMSYEAAEKMRSIAQQQRDLGSRVEQLREGAKELEQRLGDAGAMDKALQDRFNELQRMLREAMTPEMQQKLADLEQAADRLSGSEVKQSLEQLAAQQQQLREQLEKSAEMLKRAALEGAMETLRDEAQDLSAAERQLAESLARPEARQGTTPPANQGATQGQQQAGERGGERQAGAPSPSDQIDAQRLADRTKRLEQEIEALTERLRREGANTGADRTEAAQPQVKQATEAMQNVSQQLGQRTPPQGQQQAGQQGQQQQGGQQGQQQAGQQGQQQRGGQQGQQQQGGQQGQQQAGQQGQPQGARNDAAQQAQRAADAMDQAAQQLADARQSQVDAWKQDLSQQLDQAINETAQLARQQSELADRAKSDGNTQGLQGEQGAVQQGVQQAAERLEQAGRGSALLSQRSQRAMADAQQKVQQATQSMSSSGQPGGSPQSQSAMQDAAQALNQALSSLVRDRERVNSANSASGFGEMMEQMRELAKQQGSLNGQMQGLSMLPGGAQGQQAQQQARAMARQQRGVAEGLQDVADLDPSGRLDALAREAQQVAASLARGGPDPATAERQAQLYRRMLNAGRFLEQDQRDDQGPRESRAGDGRGTTGATGAASGRDGVRYAPPTWNDLRGLSADERRLVYEYFRRLNAGTP